MNYVKKMKGGHKSPSKVNLLEILWAWIGSFIGIAVIAYINQKIMVTTDQIMLIGSFGASAVLIYGAIKSPLAQPRNFVGGHIISAVIGVTVYKLFPGTSWLAAALAVATAIAAMHATKTLHPPGGATALIAVIGSPKIHAMGYLYTIIPVGVSIIIMLILALLINNISKTRKYPMSWW
ncbi:MAG: HPP family protein [Planctomycetes bacterium]|nr:HPP family protein [Planctomycetota bacterium]